MSQKIRTLLFSTLYPSEARPVHGIFVETRLRELLKSGQVESKVVSPVPWFPFSNKVFGEYGRFTATPTFEHRNGVDVFHPRYFLPPKVGMNIAPYLLARAVLPAIKKIIRDGFDFDLIDAHYYYPDGVAAALLARWIGKPLVITARGSDVNLIARYAVPRKLMRWAAEQSKVSITVSSALREALAGLGADRSKLLVLRNGIDLDVFRPEIRAVARAKLGWPDTPTLISVGNLVENKGHHIAIELLVKMPEFRLSIVGTGPERQALESLASRIGVAHRVLFAGQIAQKNLADYYSAADILILASSREGWPNVLLESMACGTPVVATNVGGVPEIVTTHHAGRMACERSVAGLKYLVDELWEGHPDRTAVRRHAEGFGWRQTTEAQLTIFHRIARGEAPLPVHAAGMAVYGPCSSSYISKSRES